MYLCIYVCMYIIEFASISSMALEIEALFSLLIDSEWKPYEHSTIDIVGCGKLKAAEKSCFV